MGFVNLTPHTLNIRTLDGGTLDVAPSGEVARVSVTRTLVGTLDGVGLYRAVKGAVTGLPDPQDGVVFVVSMAVREAVPDRSDVLSPGDLLRNEQGQPAGCDGLSIT